MIGGIGIFFVMRFDAEQLWRIAPYLYGIGIFLMIAVLIFYDRNTEASTGAKSWFALGPISFQPSEVMKPAYILMLSRVVTQHNAAFSHTIQHDWQLIGRMVLWTLPIAVLMKFQNDFGTTLVFLAIFAGVTLVAGINWRILVPIALVAGIIGTVGILLVTQTWGRSILGSIGFKTYQFARIDSWLNPSGSSNWRQLPAVAIDEGYRFWSIDWERANAHCSACPSPRIGYDLFRDWRGFRFCRCCGFDSVILYVDLPND